MVNNRLTRPVRRSPQKAYGSVTPSDKSALLQSAHTAVRGRNRSDSRISGAKRSYGYRTVH